MEFEYKLIIIDIHVAEMPQNHIDEEVLDLLGEERWQLVTALKFPDTNQVYHYFIRQKLGGGGGG